MTMTRCLVPFTPGNERPEYAVGSAAISTWLTENQWEGMQIQLNSRFIPADDAMEIFCYRCDLKETIKKSISYSQLWP